MSFEERSNGSTVIENDSVSMSAATSITFWMTSGTDTATNRYLNIPHNASWGLEVIPTVACSISEINGRTLKSALSIGTGGWSSNNMRITRFTINAGSATIVEVTAKGGA